MLKEIFQKILSHIIIIFLMKTINIKINIFLYLLDHWNRKLFLV